MKFSDVVYYFATFSASSAFSNPSEMHCCYAFPFVLSAIWAFLVL